MTSWTSARSVLLSQLLDDVVGTEEMVRIRQDYCRISCYQLDMISILTTREVTQTGWIYLAVIETLCLI